MDFSKIKEGVISLSTFLVSHAIWLVISLYSTWIAFGPQLEAKLSEFTTRSISLMNSDTAKLLLDTYSLKPLIPAFAVFVFVFVLHANKKLLVLIGRYIPPELVWHWMPGLRNISSGRWDYVLRQLGPSFSFENLRAIVVERYSEATKENNRFDYFSAYNIFKSLAVLNIILLLVSSGASSINLFYLFLVFVLASLVTALLQIYHARNESKWVIERIIQKLLAQKALGEIEAEDGEKEIATQEIKEIERFCSFESEQPIVTLSWSIPLLGNLRILKESLFRPQKLKKEKAIKND